MDEMLTDGQSGAIINDSDRNLSNWENNEISVFTENFPIVGWKGLILS